METRQYQELENIEGKISYLQAKKEYVQSLIEKYIKPLEKEIQEKWDMDKIVSVDTSRCYLGVSDEYSYSASDVEKIKKVPFHCIIHVEFKEPISTNQFENRVGKLSYKREFKHNINIKTKDNIHITRSNTSGKGEKCSVQFTFN